MVSVTYKPGGKLERLDAELSSPRAILTAIGVLFEEQAEHAFIEEKFDGKAWAPRAVPNIYGLIADFYGGASASAVPKRRFEARPVLVDTGGLAGSIKAEPPTDTSVRIGSAKTYATVQGKGGAIESKPITEAVQRGFAELIRGAGAAFADRLGFVLNPKLRGRTLKGNVEARPFLGITDQIKRDVLEEVGVRLAGV